MLFRSAAIRACQLSAGGGVGPEWDLPLSQLLCPTVTINLTADPMSLIRFRKLQNAFWRGAKVPAIIVVPGSHGTPLASVTVIQ